MKKVLVIDTSILCVWLGVTGKETCGRARDPWDKARVDQVIDRERKAGTTFVLPLASIIETGNHIAQRKGDRCHTEANRLALLITEAADGKSPWAAFTQQAVLWNTDALKDLAVSWPPLAVQGLSIGDATITDVANYYARLGYRVEILTGDQALKAREPPPRAAPAPRRRQ